MESLPAVDVFGARLSSSLGIRTRLASRGSLVSFLRAAIAALRRASSGSFGQFGAFTSFEAAAGGGRSRLGGTTTGRRAPRGAGSHHEPNPKCDDGEPQRTAQRFRRISHHPAAGFGPAHRA